MVAWSWCGSWTNERLGVEELIEPTWPYARGKNTQVAFDRPRAAVGSRLAGYADINGAERLSQDPAFRLIGFKKIWERGTALTSRLQSFETELLTRADNLAGLAALNREAGRQGGTHRCTSPGGARLGQH